MYVHLLIESRSSNYVHEVQNLHPRLSAHSSPYWSLIHPRATPTRSCKKVSRGSSNSSSAELTQKHDTAALDEGPYRDVALKHHVRPVLRMNSRYTHSLRLHGCPTREGSSNTDLTALEEATRLDANQLRKLTNRLLYWRPA